MLLTNKQTNTDENTDSAKFMSSSVFLCCNKVQQNFLKKPVVVYQFFLERLRAWQRLRIFSYHLVS